jgi:hypothetical protein
VASQRQIEANRRNARRSTGPKTPEGKAIASRNRSLHGFRSRGPLLPGEDPAEFAAALAGWHAEYQPANPDEESLVFQLAAAEWRRRRMIYLETAFFTDALSNQPGALDKWGRDPFEMLIRCQSSASNAFYKALDALTALKRENERSNPIPKTGQIQQVPAQENDSL